MRAVNIYHLTRIHDPHGISLLLEALSGRNDAKEISIHEAATLWSFTDEITGILEDRSSDTMDGWLSILDGFYFSYTIEHIGKEFDLLKFSKDSGYVLNVELKSEKIEEERIRKQLEQNRYYLSHAADTIYSFTYVMETGELYTLGADDRFEKSTMDVLADIFALDNLSEYLPEGIEKCFRAAEYLISEGWTSSSKLAIVGGSNGGLLVGACMTQRPDLFAVAVPQVGVMDMLRYHKFTIGWNWAPDYGTSEDSKEMFEYLLGYSPLHNLKPGVSYPATLVTTADHDDRVVPAHSFKFAARLQECAAGPAPALIRIDTKAGHGGGKPLAKVLEEQADIYSFILKNVGESY